MLLGDGGFSTRRICVLNKWQPRVSLCILASTIVACVGGNSVSHSLEIASLETKQFTAKLRWVDSISEADLAAAREPMLLSSPAILSALSGAGLHNFAALRKTFGEGEILLGMEESFNPRAVDGMFHANIADYVDELLDPNTDADRLAEPGGREFFLSRPKLSETLGRAFASVLPDGYQMASNFTEEDLLELTEAAAEGDLQVSDLTLWAANAGFSYPLHLDYLPGNLLAHVDGVKRVWLFPPEQEELLYLHRPDNDKNWEANSDIGLTFTDTHATFDANEFPLFVKATPIVVDLHPGHTLFIPCGWPHAVQYITSGFSVSCQVLPDFIVEKMNEEHEWSPKSCADFLYPDDEEQEEDPARDDL